ncbi:MAG: hypothetical protein Kow0037_28640 [Calditrichia bacterium]
MEKNEGGTQLRREHDVRTTLFKGLVEHTNEQLNINKINRRK